ncbi:uncharacterized protein B0I36DRAFT_142360 [Microdochium trichocladiopsis]|uniref:Uncharacterized protein n=1 Tax=Microdochium trichocladiopsis TaxID=1682393 RepID=A0A9P8Y4C8_9PEZI|nr:uncharacterized protein B0I36DRAFT_142360 [Microdochium trichocladiopsis]KAH7027717.1 hypothetical protein B0I36DRAFT_142360 [Microdochium trichocladiopsis]
MVIYMAICCLVGTLVLSIRRRIDKLVQEQQHQQQQQHQTQQATISLRHPETTLSSMAQLHPQINQGNFHRTAAATERAGRRERSKRRFQNHPCILCARGLGLILAAGIPVLGWAVLVRHLYISGRMKKEWQQAARAAAAGEEEAAPAGVGAADDNSRPSADGVNGNGEDEDDYEAVYDIEQVSKYDSHYAGFRQYAGLSSSSSGAASLALAATSSINNNDNTQAPALHPQQQQQSAILYQLPAPPARALLTKARIRSYLPTSHDDDDDDDDDDNDDNNNEAYEGHSVDFEDADDNESVLHRRASASHNAQFKGCPSETTPTRRLPSHLWERTRLSALRGVSAGRFDLDD